MPPPPSPSQFGTLTLGYIALVATVTLGLALVQAAGWL